MQQLSATAFCSAVALFSPSRLNQSALSWPAQRSTPRTCSLDSRELCKCCLHFLAVCHSVGLLLSRRRRPPTTGAHICSRDQPTAPSRSNKNIQNETHVQCDTPAFYTQQHARSMDALLEPLLLSIPSRLRRLTREFSLSLSGRQLFSRALPFFRCSLARSLLTLNSHLMRLP
jgi:hypothetical protein